MNVSDSVALFLKWVEHGLFDDLICLENDCSWNRQAQCLRRLQVDLQLKPRGLLDWEIRRLCTPEDHVHVVRGSNEQIAALRCVGQETTSLDPPHRVTHRW